MTAVIDLSVPDYNHIIEETFTRNSLAVDEIDAVLSDLREHIRKIDERVFVKRNELLIAIRLVEAFRIFKWIKVCLACGSYQSVFRELRFMLDAIAQACYIDLNHVDVPLSCKLEVFKALGENGGFIGSRLFERISGFQEKRRLIDLYKQLSRFVHPSIEESRKRIESRGSEEEVVDSLKRNRFDPVLLAEALTKCKDVAGMLLSVNSHFVNELRNCSETE
ncbi:hypothetical protein ACFL2Q_18650 [Thermodesulfobacteriota bacterium]